MNHNLVTAKPKRNIRWAPMTMAIVVLLVNAWISQRGTGLDGALRHCASLFIKVENGEVPYALSAMANVDPFWQRVKLTPDLLTERTTREIKNIKLPGVAGQCLRARNALDVPRNQRARLLRQGMKREPQNALYPMLMAQDLFISSGISAEYSRDKWKPTLVHDPSKMMSALSYYQKALRCPVYTDHGVDYNQFRLSTVSQRDIRLMEQVLACAEIKDDSITEGLTEIRVVSRYAGMAMSYLAMHGQPQQAMLLATSWQSTYLYWLMHAPTLIDAMMMQACISLLTGATEHTAVLCGHEKVAAEYKALGKDISNARSAYRSLDQRRMVDQYGGLVANSYMSFFVNTAVDSLEPSRSADHAFLERVVAHKLSMLAGCLLVLVLVWIAFREKPTATVNTKPIITVCVLSLMPWVVYAFLLLKPELMGRQYGIIVSSTELTTSLIVPAVLSLFLPAICLMVVQQSAAKPLVRFVIAILTAAYCLMLVITMIYLAHSPFIPVDWLACMVFVVLVTIAGICNRIMPNLPIYNTGCVPH